jgi:uncharacterized protein YutE (UPF0331/DUF86 family)
MDQSVVDAKLESLRRCVSRVAEKFPPTAAELARNVDAQDIIAVNLSRAVQLCIDLALHKISSTGETAPSTMSGAFDTLSRLGTIDEALAKRMKSAVGFRNLAVHQYEVMNWEIVHAICTKHLDDFRAFAVAIRTT